MRTFLLYNIFKCRVWKYFYTLLADILLCFVYNLIYQTSKKICLYRMLKKNTFNVSTDMRILNTIDWLTMFLNICSSFSVNISVQLNQTHWGVFFWGGWGGGYVGIDDQQCPSICHARRVLRKITGYDSDVKS